MWMVFDGAMVFTVWSLHVVCLQSRLQWSEVGWGNMGEHCQKTIGFTPHLHTWCWVHFCPCELIILWPPMSYATHSGPVKWCHDSQLKKFLPGRWAENANGMKWEELGSPCAKARDVRNKFKGGEMQAGTVRRTEVESGSHCGASNTAR